MENIEWKVKAFQELSVEEYFEILYLRTAIFVVEQNCSYQEVDLKDKKSFHLFGRNRKGDVIGVSRILPPKISYDEISIGRVALQKEYRGKGVADELLKQTLTFIEQKYGKQPIRISAQKYLVNYYSRFAFFQVGKEYLEDNIPHIEMLLQI